MPGLVVPADRPGRLALSLLLACWLLVSSCTPADPPTPAVTPTAVQVDAAQRSLDVLSTAVLHHSAEVASALVATRDPRFHAAAAAIYASLTALPLTSLSFRLQPPEGELAPARRALLGPTAFVRQVSVSWRVSGDVGPADHLLWLTFVPDGAITTIAGTTDGPGDRVPEPLWLRGEVVALRSTATTVLAPSSAAGRRWQAGGDAAVRAVRARLRSGLGARWNGRLVIEVPATRSALEHVLGVTPGSYAQIAAVAWPEGSDPAAAAVRIVVNPDLAPRLDEQSMQVLLTHEATHVATRSAASAAPTWVVEGFADYVAYASYPATAGRAAAAVLADARAHGAPQSLPADSQFSPSAADLERSYAESWLACRFLAEHYSATALARFYRDVDAGTSVDEALRSVVGSSERQFVRGWASSLRAAARRAPGG